MIVDRAYRIAAALTLAAVLGQAAPRPAAAQDDESRLLATAAGGALGIVGGGYIALSVIVAESRAGRYVHDMSDILGWRSVPVIAGAVIGGSLGAYSPRRLEAAVVYGAAGLGLGGLAGFGLGSIIWSPPEGGWAGAAIGAGVGLVVGNLIGALYPYRDAEEDGNGVGAAGGPRAAGIPIMVRIPF